MWVEETKLEFPDMTYLQIICEYADVNGCEYDVLASSISASLKQKIFQEAKGEYSMRNTVPVEYHTAMIE